MRQGEIGKVNIKLELLQNHINDIIRIIIENVEPDVSKIADTTAITLLDQIKNIICNEKLSDFDAIEEIVCILEKNSIYCGDRHDF